MVTASAVICMATFLFLSKGLSPKCYIVGLIIYLSDPPRSVFMCFGGLCVIYNVQTTKLRVDEVSIHGSSSYPPCNDMIMSEVLSTYYTCFAHSIRACMACCFACDFFGGRRNFCDSTPTRLEPLQIHMGCRFLGSRAELLKLNAVLGMSCLK